MEKGMEAVEASKMQIGQRGVRTIGAVHEVLLAIIVGKSSGMRTKKKKGLLVKFQNPLNLVDQERSFQRLG